MKTPPTDLAELQQAWRRYEHVRKMDARQFSQLLQLCCFQDLRFDDVIDERIEAMEARDKP